MFDNITFGPFCCYMNDKHCQQITKEIFIENWLPLYRASQGEILNWITSGVPPEAKKNIAGVLITYAYLKTYEA